VEGCGGHNLRPSTLRKWLKDRKGRTLGWDDIRHYQKIIKILSETDRIMQQINLPMLSNAQEMAA
jgi:hypothetical protein